MVIRPSQLQENKLKKVNTLNTFSCRAECLHDLDIFMARLIVKDHDAHFSEPADSSIDPIVEIKSKLNEEELRAIMNECDDCHVMSETLHQVPIRENDMVRSYQVYRISNVLTNVTHMFIFEQKTSVMHFFAVFGFKCASLVNRYS